MTHIGPVQLHDQAGLGIHEMRVLGRLGQNGEVNVVAADLSGNGAKVRRGGDDVEFGESRLAKGGEEQTAQQ